MIPLKFKDEGDLLFYNEFIQGFKSKIIRIKNKGQIGKGSSIDNLKKYTIDFLEYLLTDENLFDLANCPADKLLDKANTIRKDFPKLKLSKQISIPFKQVKKIFVDAYTQLFPKAEFIKALDIKVCPYCNRSYVECIDKKDGSSPIKGQIDHFYSKEEYPFLALSRYNLIPSCNDCNGVGGKFRKEASEISLVNPYLLKDSNGLKFTMDITAKGFLNLKECEESISIKVQEENNSGLDSNIKTFHLQEIYQSHRDIAAEIYLKGKLRMPQYYRKAIIKQLSPLNITDHDFNKIVLGIEDNPQNFRNQSLSKFKADLAKDELFI